MHRISCNRILTASAKRVSLSTALFCFITFILSNPVWCAPDSNVVKASDLSRQKMDVIVIVWPVSSHTARIAVAYQTKKREAIVRADITKLTSYLGGAVSDVQITTTSVRPSDLKNYPVTTAAMCTVTGCSQIAGSAPNLRPYIRAYQDNPFVEVVFAIPTIAEYFGPVHFDLPEVSLELVKEPDAYRYEAAIREHRKDLPAFPQNHIVTRNGPDLLAVNSTSGHDSKSQNPGGVLMAFCAISALVVVIMSVYTIKVLRQPQPRVKPRRSSL